MVLCMCSEESRFHLFQHLMYIAQVLLTDGTDPYVTLYQIWNLIHVDNNQTLYVIITLYLADKSLHALLEVLQVMRLTHVSMF